jgi:nitrate/nitrite transport system ATP-binding protein
LQDEVERIWEQERKTVIMITHSIEEALLLSDRIVMMTRGPAARVDEILEVPFPRPRNRETIDQHPAYHDLKAEMEEPSFPRNPSGGSRPSGWVDGCPTTHPAL